MEYHLKIATTLTELLDNKFSILGIRFGLDPLLDFIPILGDLLGAVLSFYLVWLAYQVHVPEDKIHEMIGNIIFDFILGLIPIIGEIGDMLYKSNVKNLAIIMKYYNPATEAEIVSRSPLSPAIYR